MKHIAATFILALAFVVSACGSPTQAPTLTQPPLAPSATAPATSPAATPSAPAAGPTVAPSVGPTVTPMPATATPAPAVVATSTANPAIALGLLGLWKGNNNSFYLINNDGTWNWDQDGQKVLITPENQGRWWLEGDIFRIQDRTGKAPCPLNQVGSYQAQLSGDTLVFTAVADLCSVRIDQTAGQYARQPAGP